MTYLLKTLFALTSFLTLLTTAAFGFETRATSAYVVDVTTNTVLMNKNADIPLPPASMSKLMTLNMLFEALEDGRITLSTPFSVSQRASNMGGSTMFLSQGDRPTVEDLIQGIIVQSGNDACVAAAEGLAGTEEAFARMMTQRAKALGMNNSSFGNASGWPHPMQRMSMQDLAILAKRLTTKFPAYYNYFSQTEYHYKGRAPDNRFNRNPLLKLGLGADGLKTGHTQEAGYGMVGSARQGDRRIIFVYSGLSSSTQRAEEGEAIINWAFRQFSKKTIYKAGEKVTEAPVWLGAEKHVTLVPAADINLLIPASQRDGVKATVTYQSPIPAPIKTGQALATLTLELDGLPNQTVPLVAQRDVGGAGFGTRILSAGKLILSRLFGTSSDPTTNHSLLPAPTGEN